MLALERHEALRALDLALKDGGSLADYNAVWQPLDVRLGRAEEVDARTLDEAARLRNISIFSVFDPQLADARMQNMVMLAVIAGNDLIPGIGPDDYRQAMEDLMTGTMLYRNQALFERNLHGEDRVYR